MRVDFARLNHILIPKTKEGRDRFRRSLIGRLVSPIGAAWWALTDEGRTMVLLTPLVGALAVDVRGTSAYVLFSIMAGLLAGALVASRLVRVDAARVTVDAPRRVTIGETITFTVTCKNDGAAHTPPLRVRGPYLPWDGTWTGGLGQEVRVAPERAASVTMNARFIARGLHHLDPFTIAPVAPLGLTCGPRKWSEAVKVWVVPRIARVVRLPVAIASRHQPGGVALASKSGESMDLLGVRPYRPGDPVRDLHARSWARTGMPLVREYQQEYFTRVGVVLDTDTDDPDVLEASVELAAGVIAHLSRGEALIDVLVVGDRVHELTLGRSLGYLEQALELLAEVERGPELRADGLLRRLEPHLALLSSVVLITVRGPAKDGTDERRALEKRIQQRGVTCTRIAVDDAVVRAIQAKEALSW